jgi:hypothetical protein
LLTQSLAPEDDRILTTKVVLATAHLDHNPSNNKARNLKAYCQRCHLLHDREEHRRQRRITFRKRNALGDLFLALFQFNLGAWDAALSDIRGLAAEG